MKCRNILRHLMQKNVFVLWPHLNHRIPSDFKFNKNLALVLETVAWKYDPFTARKKQEGKEKAPQAFFTKELSKTSSLHQPLDIFAA